MSAFRLLLASAALTAMGGLVASDVGLAASGKPRWVLHVEQYPGGISNGVRASLDPGVIETQGRYKATLEAPRSAGTGNVQMNNDSYPGVPQNEESVAYSTDDPFTAVAAANDYVSGGVVVMRTNEDRKSVV